ncbi:energy transducer TonB [Algoriphagus chordae]|uniref:Protein TonB n=1 Tax=Algoriphagus chordae TaxID=237019 RepID=A0A2W7QJU0_9BACT|nr:energy transducer TonB [Algoriphagus chordae]PZX47576.1 protein TonB [Algoriphagus chordae]
MKTLSAILVMIIVCSTVAPSIAQNQIAYLHSASPRNERIIKPVSAAPSYAGGYDALCEYLNKNLHYPYLAKVRGIEGRVVVEFVINESGNIEDIKLVESLSGSLDEEALRLVRKMPRWIPASHNGIAKSVRYQLPIQFSID